ncbi:MAG: SBBP repeat-containing protein, partial [Gammaproteobacteria bacterium]
MYSTFLGGSSAGESTNGIAVDGLGNAYLTGRTGSDDFPVTPGAYQSGFAPGFTGHGFLSKINAQGTALIYSTYLRQMTTGIAIDSAGNAYVLGVTPYANFPTTDGVFQRTLAPGACHTGPCTDAFVLKMNPTGSALVYSTFFGGSAGDGARAIAVDRDGNAYIAGVTSSTDLPGADAAPGRTYVAKINPSASTLLWSRYLGGSTDDWVSDLGFDRDGNLLVAGSTASRDFPLANPIQMTNTGSGCTLFANICYDAFITRFTPEGAITFSTYFGGTGNDGAVGAAGAPDGGIIVVGDWRTHPIQFPAVNPLQTFAAVPYVIKISEAGQIPLFTAAGVTNAASYVPGFSPGQLATIFGRNLTNSPGVIVAGTTPLPTELDGISVKLDGVALPLLAVANVNGQEQINFQVPSPIPFVSGGGVLTVNRRGTTSVAVPLAIGDRTTVAYAVPGIFTVDGELGAVQHADYRPVGSSDPAAKGEVVIVYATGLG